MKRIISLLCMVMILTTSVYAMDDSRVEEMLDALEKNEKFQVEVEGSTFILTLDTNPTTGFEWVYTLSDEDQLTLVSDEIVTPNIQLMGAPSKRILTFDVKEDGVYTILFEYQRSFEENSTTDSIDVLVYMNDGKLIVEENKIVTIMDKIDEGDITREIIIEGSTLDLDVKTEVIDGVIMVPVALPLRALGYEVSWESETSTVEIIKGAQYTSVSIDKNAYFKNKMAASSLTSAPILQSGRTMVPVEFFTEILGLSVRVEDYNLIFEKDKLQNDYKGVVKAITYDETGSGQITVSLGDEETSDSFLNEKIVLNVGPAFTYIQGDLKVGDTIVAYTSMATTKSIPAQTSAYMIYVLSQGITE